MREETLADNATPEALATQQEAPMARQQHMEEVEDVALRNIERAADRCVPMALDRPKSARHLKDPARGTSSLIRDFSKAGLTPNWEPTAYKCGG